MGQNIFLKMEEQRGAGITLVGLQEPYCSVKVLPLVQHYEKSRAILFTVPLMLET